MGHLHGVARPPRAVTSLYLSMLFVGIYGGSSWLTSLRADVGTWHFDWEHHLPFVSWLIVPYMSLDLFFVAAPFLCADVAELRALRRRMTVAILAAGVLFLVVPLRFAFARPEPADWTGPIFSFLHGFDRPYNLFPSLHIAILTILAGTYVRRSRGIVRVLLHTWFGLIGLSAVLTYQHHVIDVAGGFVLALFCVYSIPEQSILRPVTTNPRIGARYAVAAAILAGLGGFSFQLPASSFRLPVLILMAVGFFWAALSLSIVAGGYFGLFKDVTRKQSGRLPTSTRLMLAPWLLGQHLSLVYYRRQCRPWDEVVPNVWMGRRLNGREAAAAVAAGVTAVLDLTGEFSEAEPFLAVPYLNLAVLDLTAPTQPQLRAAAGFISAHRETGVVYVHCKIGYSRSAAVVGAWLLDAGIAQTPDEAVARMRTVRPTLVVRSEAWRALCETTPHFIPART
jgi:protein-tyrosine phosphatase/membrane-associated phospholipid phosphatase